jgi:hypothetical protein
VAQPLSGNPSRVRPRRQKRHSDVALGRGPPHRCSRIDCCRLAGSLKLDEPVGNAEARPRYAEMLEAAKALERKSAIAASTVSSVTAGPLPAQPIRPDQPKPRMPHPSALSANHRTSRGTRRGTTRSTRRAGSARGAFAVLDALAQADAGLGLTGLARASGLAKTSAYRLAEQLVTLGAVQRVDERYYVGARVGRIGQQWQPDPFLRRAAQATVHALAVKSRAVASLRILHEHRLRMICGTMPHGHACMPNPADTSAN